MSAALRRAGDGDRLGHRRQVVAQEDDVGRGPTDVGRGGHGHRDVRRGEGGGVVEAVAHHQDLVAPRCQRRDAGDLRRRRDLGQERHAKPGRQPAHGRVAIAAISGVTRPRTATGIASAL